MKSRKTGALEGTMEESTKKVTEHEDKISNPAPLDGQDKLVFARIITEIQFLANCQQEMEKTRNN